MFDRVPKSKASRRPSHGTPNENNITFTANISTVSLTSILTHRTAAGRGYLQFNASKVNAQRNAAQRAARKGVSISSSGVFLPACDQDRMWQRSTQQTQNKNYKLWVGDAPVETASRDERRRSWGFEGANRCCEMSRITPAVLVHRRGGSRKPGSDRDQVPLLNCHTQPRRPAVFVDNTASVLMTRVCHIYIECSTASCNQQCFRCPAGCCSCRVSRSLMSSMMQQISPTD